MSLFPFQSSAYIKPFEEEMRDWEDKLISMQDILGSFSPFCLSNDNCTKKLDHFISNDKFFLSFKTF